MRPGGHTGGGAEGAHKQLIVHGLYGKADRWRHRTIACIAIRSHKPINQIIWL